jgi:regulator of sirC expression with transglutaminase-like and TPR domain
MTTLPRRSPADRRGDLSLIAVATVATVAITLASCRSAEPRPPGTVARTIVATAAELGAEPVALVDAWGQLERIAARVDERHRHSRGDAIDDLTAVVFDELGFVREIDDDDPRFFLLPSVLSTRRGSCLGLGTLYLMVAERIGLPLDAVRVPGHFFVRTRGPRPRNIELLRRGETMPDAWYRQKYGPWPEENGSYLRPLSVQQVSALFWFNAGNFARRQGELARGRRQYERAVAEAPDFAEAHASLGLARQLEGALPGAARAYRDAARARADLPGLGHNMALLDRELPSDTPPLLGRPSPASSAASPSPTSPSSPRRPAQ